MSRARAATLVAMCVAAACGVRDAPLPETRLGGTSAEFGTPFNEIRSLVELPDRRVIVAESKPVALWLVDFAANTRTALGREGDGPREYRDIGVLFAGGADSVFVDDWRNLRFVVYAAGALTPTPIPRSTFGAVLKVRDRAGRLYAQEPMANKDSVAIVRWTPASGRIDTLAYNRVHDVSTKQESSGDGAHFSTAVGDYPGGDVWGAFDDGTLLIARAADYQIERVSADGARTLVQRVPYTRVAKTEGERMVYGGSSYRQPVRASWGPAPPGASRDGVLWVRRTTDRADDAEEYDLLDVNGHSISHVRFPAGAQLIGFGASTVYVVHENADGSQRLMRYARPAAAPAK